MNSKHRSPPLPRPSPIYSPAMSTWEAAQMTDDALYARRPGSPARQHRCAARFRSSGRRAVGNRSAIGMTWRTCWAWRWRSCATANARASPSPCRMIFPSCISIVNRWRARCSTCWRTPSATRRVTRPSGWVPPACRMKRAFWVEDAGPGVPAEERQLIFEKFYRGTTAGAAPGGTGLGLTIAAEIVHFHQGRLLVEEVHPHGARFVIVLPREAGDGGAR